MYIVYDHCRTRDCARLNASRRLTEITILSDVSDLSAQSHVPGESSRRRHRARISGLFRVLREEENSVLGPQSYRTVPNFDPAARFARS